MPYIWTDFFVEILEKKEIFAEKNPKKATVNTTNDCRSNSSKKNLTRLWAC